MIDELNTGFAGHEHGVSLSLAAIIKLKQRERENIARLTDQFLVSGGTIQMIDAGESALNKSDFDIPDGVREFKNADGTTYWRYMRDDGAWCGSYAQLHLAKIARAEWIKQTRKALNRI